MLEGFLFIFYFIYITTVQDEQTVSDDDNLYSTLFILQRYKLLRAKLKTVIYILLYLYYNKTLYAIIFAIQKFIFYFIYITTSPIIAPTLVFSAFIFYFIYITTLTIY